MISQGIRLMPAVVALWFLSCSGALACNVGDIQCEKGYKYVCKCWTATGCNYEPDGTCYRDDGAGPSEASPHVNLSVRKYVREARWMCTDAPATAALGACAGR
jgi:hypothetical protein